MSTATRCDGCGRFAPTPATNGQRRGLSLPAGWLHLDLADAHDGKAAGDFCSADCAAEWLLELGQVAAERSAAADLDNGTPPHEWDPAMWVAFCRQHGVKQAEVLPHIAEEASAEGFGVSKWADLSKYPDLADRARRYVLTHSATVTAKAAS